MIKADAFILKGWFPMENVYFRAALLLVVCLIAAVVVAVTVWRQEGVDRKRFAIGAVLCLLVLLAGFIPGVRTYVSSLLSSRVSDGIKGTVLVLAFIVPGVCLGLALVGRKALAEIVLGIVARMRVAVEELRDPELRRRNVCIRRYRHALDILAKPPEGNRARRQRNSLLVAITILHVTDDEIPVLADYLNKLLFEGNANVDHFADFLEEEREMVQGSLVMSGGHLIRLTRLTEQIRRETTHA